MKPILFFTQLFLFGAAFVAVESLAKGSTELKVGIGANYKTTTYKAENSLSAVPLAFYDNDVWYIEGTEAGYYPYKDDKNHFRVGLTYDGRSFNPSDADVNLQSLDKRKSSALAHASHMYVSKFGGIRTKVATDILGKHKGTTASVAYISRFTFDDTTIYPSAGLVWHDKKYSDYYYGVSNDESLRSGLTAYTAEAGISPFMSITANHELNDKVTLFGNARTEWLSDSEKDSPMTNKKVGSSVIIGAMYRFK